MQSTLRSFVCEFHTINLQQRPLSGTESPICCFNSIVSEQSSVQKASKQTPKLDILCPFSSKYTRTHRYSHLNKYHIVLFQRYSETNSVAFNGLAVVKTGKYPSIFAQFIYYSRMLEVSYLSLYEQWCFRMLPSHVYAVQPGKNQQIPIVKMQRKEILSPKIQINQKHL